MAELIPDGIDLLPRPQIFDFNEISQFPVIGEVVWYLECWFEIRRGLKKMATFLINKYFVTDLVTSMTV